MEFLDNQTITKKIVGLLSSNEETKIAVAYWGRDALRLLRLNPRRRNIHVLCCLKGGKSDPSIICQFGMRARQLDNLHAKVFWTRSGAIVGSANASANGLPEEESNASNLIEAGMYVNDTGELAKIRQWFEKLYVAGRKITKSDLEDAARERAVRAGGRAPKRPFLKALLSNPSEFSQQRIYFYLYQEFCSDEENRSVEQDVRDHSEEIKAVYGQSDLKKFEWYTFSRRKPPEGFFPRNSILIEGRYHRGRIKLTEIYVCKTFDLVNARPITVDGQREWMVLILDTPYISGFNYDLTIQDKRVISEAAKELWNKGQKGIENDRLISLMDARPILLRHLRAAK